MNNLAKTNEQINAYLCGRGTHLVVASGSIYFSILRRIMDSYFLLGRCE